jgi:hypothetical protein
MATGSGTGTPISGGSIWADSTYGDTYFASRHGVGTRWSDLSSAQKTALLTTAQADIEHEGRWKFTDDDGVALDVTDLMRDAVCEQALFRLLDPDVDLRAALMSQGVVAADEIGETYERALLREVAVAPKARALLTGFVQGKLTGSFTLSK